MHKTIIVLASFLTLFNFTNLAQESTNSSEKYGNTLNFGLGVGGYYGYYRYVGHSMPVLHLDYEFEVANSFTLAPFVNIYSYNRRHKYDSEYYNYRQTVVPIGLKGTYYFDKLLQAGSKWDFYLAGSLGYALVFSRWDDGYLGDKNFYAYPRSIYLDIHIGAEYHVNNKIGVFLDLSSGVSTIGIAIH
jgi:hypothetical protein